MTYAITPELKKAISIVVSLQEYPHMPSVREIILELDHLSKSIQESEQFYAVPFRKASKGSNTSAEDFDVVFDVKSNLEEFYFGGAQDAIFGFRPRAYYRLVVEPLLDELAKYSHDQILDSAPNIIEQVKEYFIMYDAAPSMNASDAYELYRKKTADQQKEKKVKEITAGVLAFRKKMQPLLNELASGRRRTA